MRILLFFILLFGCATQPTYKVGGVIREETTVFLTDNYDGIPDREPDLKSQLATLSDYPDDTIPTWYRVSVRTELRDFPSFRESKVTGMLNQGDLVVGQEIEGRWMRVYKNSYVYMPHVEKVQKVQNLK